jgi:phosphoglycolate phosphatase-like HAD superfamily hydrolase
MSDQLILFIQKLKANRSVQTYSEDAAKQAIIQPILRMLGWDTDSVEEVFPEFSVESRRVDYCLRANGGKVFLEAKKPSEELDRHQKQLLEYAFSEGIKLAILTNGITWSFYLPLKEGNWQNRLFYTIDIVEQESNEVASRFSDYLSKSNVASGTALTNAESILEGKRKEDIIEETIPEAWNKIISDSDSLLVDLIAELTEKLSGFKPTPEKVKRFLERYGDRFLLLPEDEVEELEETHPTTVTLPPLRRTLATPIQDNRKVSQDDLIPFIVKILQKYGGRADKERVEAEIYQMFQSTFEHPWYQELVSHGIPRWQHNVAWARERAKKRGLIRSPKESGRGVWELSEAGRKMSV